MRLLVFLSVILISSLSAAEKASDLVDVNKNSKLSDYFKKINKDISSSDSEKKPLSLDKKDTRAEEDILLQEATKKSEATSKVSPVNKMVFSIFGLLLIAGVFFAGVQKFGSKKGHTEIAKNITVLTQKPIGPKKNLMLIRVAGETILLGVTDHNINHLKTLSLLEDELPSYTEPKFANQLKKTIEKTRITNETEEVDGFSVSRLDDVKNAVTERFSLS